LEILNGGIGAVFFFAPIGEFDPTDFPIALQKCEILLGRIFGAGTKKEEHSQNKARSIG
jgi:hypothetical protein